MVMFKAALEGKTDAAREIREAIEGKTGQRQEISDEKPVRVVFENIGPRPSLIAVDDAPLGTPVSRRSAE